MMSTVTLSNVEFVGTLKNVSSIVLTFNGALDPVTSQEVSGYAFGKPLPSSDNSGFDVGSLFNPFRRTGHEEAALAQPKAIKNGKVQFSSAVYDSAADTVTLTPVAPFSAAKFLRVLRVRGIGSNAVKDASGNPLAGGTDEVIHWNVHQGKTYRYVDNQGNHVTLKLRGPGTLDIFTQRGGNPDPTIFLDGAGVSSVLTGSVIQDGKFSGTTNISELEGAETVSNNLIDNPSFEIQSVLP